MKIKIGTRKSKLALVQTNMVADRILAEFPNTEIELVHITTKGDKVLDKPLSAIGGKGVFVSEIENALQSGRIDIAVHSAKDLPVCLGDGLEISGVLERGNYRDVLVTRKGAAVKNTPDFIVGTGSLRRRINLGKIYNQVGFKDIRGNVDTRLNKLKNGEYDAIILAAAGLERLDLIKDESFDFTCFDYADFLPAPCQGIIAVESRKNDFVTPIINKINDENTFTSFETEKHVLSLLNGDCTLPIGAYSLVKNGRITLVVSRDGSKISVGTTDVSNRFKLLEELISKL